MNLTLDMPAIVPGSYIDGRWIEEEGTTIFDRRNPSKWSEITARVPMGTASAVAAASQAAVKTQASWSCRSGSTRTAILSDWAAGIEAQEDELARLLVLEIGKPIRTARDEVLKACEFIRAATRQLEAERKRIETMESRARIWHRPLGVVGLITPWNNPLAIPAGKIAAALVFGNGVVWKPAIEAPRTAMAMMELLREAAIPPGLVNLVFGNADTAHSIAEQAGVAALSVTGSIFTGRSVAAQCSRLRKPLQCELGGNNAAVVLEDCDIEAVARPLALSAFLSAGQRCTAVRRFVVVKSVADEFEQDFSRAIETLHVGDPAHEKTEVGPLVSMEHRDNVLLAIRNAIGEGAELVLGADTPDRLDAGCWLSPAVLRDVSSDSGIVREETFGPVAVILPVDGLDEAIEQVNGVEQGLVAVLCSSSESHRRTFADRVEAGIIQFNAGPLDVDPHAPFGGWKASGMGPPEHGAWDREFYSRPQAIYG